MYLNLNLEPPPTFFIPAHSQAPHPDLHRKRFSFTNEKLRNERKRRFLSNIASKETML